MTTVKQLIIKIDLENDALADSGNLFEAARILRELADKIESCNHAELSKYQNLRDINGNTCGQYAIKDQTYPLICSYCGNIA